MKLLSWINHEVKFQVKNGLYVVYIVVNLIYIFLLGYVPPEYIDLATTLIIYSDPTMLGMIFVGAFILLEKSNGVIKGLGITPLGTRGYILGKVISMLIISLVTSFFIVISYKGINFNMFIMFITISISSVIFTMIGIIASAYAKSMNQYLAIIGALGGILSLPLLNFIGFDFKILNVFPMYNIISLVWQSIVNVEPVTMNIIVLIVWSLVLEVVTEYVVENKLFKG